MPDYYEGKIYKIINSVSNNIYVGSTTTTLVTRLSGHRSEYNRNKNKNKSDRKTTTSYKLFHEDYDNIKIKLIENYPCYIKKELEERERYWIEKIDCVNFVIPTRTAKEWYLVNKEKCKIDNAKWIKNHKEIRREQHNERKITDPDVHKRFRANNKEKLSIRRKELYQLKKQKNAEIINVFITFIEKDQRHRFE